ncbi:hypothetical protein HDV06_004786 [Boothiomyces sp. JEL0866]|nr:hypothetical protein HDV06_004786 [Boothiomyces sp. JEL0866]
MYPNAYFSDLYLQQLAGHCAPVHSINGGLFTQHPLFNADLGAHCAGYPFNQRSLLNNTTLGNSQLQSFGGQMNLYAHQNPILAHLLDARRGDILRSELVYQVANNLCGVRNVDNIVRAIAIGRPIAPTEVVKTVLADRIKDEKVARLLKAIATEQKLNHKVDDVVNVLQSANPVVDIELARMNDHRRDAANRIFAAEAQSLLTHDLISQAHLGSFARVHGFHPLGFDGYGGVSSNFGMAPLANAGINGLGGLGNLNAMGGMMGSGMENIDKYGSALQQVLACRV